MKQRARDVERCRTRNLILVCILIAVCIPCTVSSAGTETLISTGLHDSNQEAPSTWGDYIVWEDQGGGPGHIVLLNITSGQIMTISDPASDARSPRIQGPSVVWYENRAGSSDIFHYDIPSGLTTRITGYDAVKLYPAVYGTRIVWQELMAVDDLMGISYYDILMYDRADPRQVVNLTPHPGDIPGVDDATHEYPSIWGDYVVWQDWDDMRYTLEIFLNDTATGNRTQISDDTGFGIIKRRPVISGTSILWVDDRGGDADIFSDTFPPAVDTDLTPYSGSVQDLPALDGESMIWLDDRDHAGTFYQIGMNTLSAPSEIYPLSPEGHLSATSYQAVPSVYNNRVVWRDDRDPTGYSEIYMYTEGVSVTCPVAGFTQNISSGSPPLLVQFSDTTSPSPSYWFWDFGDGTNSTVQNPLHTFSGSSTYPVTLTAGTPFCRNATSRTTAHNISVGAAPVVGFTASPLEGTAPLTVSFTESSSGSPETWNWSFGDGTFSDEQNPSHTYTTGGRYSVRCNATNAFGTGTLTRSSYITVTAGAHEIAFTNITGITVRTLGNRQYLTYDHTLLSDYAMTPGGSAFISHPPPEYGWKNITFFSDDGVGFASDATHVSGNVSATDLTTGDILPGGFSSTTGNNVRLNYRITMSGYREPAWLITDVWEGTTPSDNKNVVDIYTQCNFASVNAAYTVNTTRTNLSTLTRGKINMSVGSGWMTGTEGITWGRENTYVIATGYNATGDLLGMVLPAQYTFNDTVDHLEYFEAEIPPQYIYFNKYVLVTLSGTGNPFQLITLTVTSHVPQEPPVSEPADSDDSSGDSGAGGGFGTVPVIVTAATPAPAPTIAPPDPGKSAKIYTNAGGVVTQAIRLPSTDGRAVISIGEGVVARDPGGRPLAEITLKALPSADLPAVPPGSAFTFAGMAYEIGPDGARFQPPFTLTFTLPQAQWGKDYTIKSFDRKSGTWQDLPTAFDAARGTITAEVPDLCVFALFNKPREAPVTTPAKTPLPVPSAPLVKAQPPTTAVSIFTNMLTWVADLVMNNAIILVVVVILAAIGVYIIRQGRFPGP